MQQNWTRRHFLQAAGLTVAAQGVPFAAGLPAQSVHTHAYVAAHGSGTQSGIHVLRAVHGQWQPMQFVKSVAPSAVLLSSDSGLLFVANARRRYNGLPTASVQGYRIDPNTRALTHVGTQRLALASVMPHALALSPDGSLLVVAAAAGMYNVLPVMPGGAIGEVTAVRKELQLDTIASSQMTFADDSHLHVQDASGSRLYRCDRNGMSLLETSVPASGLTQAAAPSIVAGQSSVAFARFA